MLRKTYGINDSFQFRTKIKKILAIITSLWSPICFYHKQKRYPTVYYVMLTGST
jgi:hypothetical protein